MPQLPVRPARTLITDQRRSSPFGALSAADAQPCAHFNPAGTALRRIIWRSRRSTGQVVLPTPCCPADDPPKSGIEKPRAMAGPLKDGTTVPLRDSNMPANHQSSALLNRKKIFQSAHKPRPAGGQAAAGHHLAPPPDSIQQSDPVADGGLADEAQP